MSSGSVGWISANFGVPSTVWPAVDGGLAGFDRIFAQPYTVVQLTGGTQRWFITGQQRYPLPASVQSAYSAFGPPQQLGQAQLDAYAEGAPMQRAVRATDGRVYVLDGTRRYSATCDQVAALAMNCATMPLILDSQLSVYGSATPLSTLLKRSDGSIWFPQAGSRRETPRPAVLARYGVPATTSDVSADLLAPTPVGDPVLGYGVVTDRQGHYLAVGSSGSYGVTAAAVVNGLSSAATGLTAESFARLHAAGSLPLRVTTDGRSLISVDGGWLEVTSSSYGASTFATVVSGAETGVPTVGTQKAAHFVRERSSGQVYLASGGLSKVASPSALQWIATTYGVPPRVWVASDGTLAGLPGF